ncbi:MAG: alpha/beta fold hydrolase [Hyphomicrobiales bacterium]
MDIKAEKGSRERISFTGSDENTLVGDLHRPVGDIHARTLVLLHGGGQTRHSWRSTADRLAERGWTAVALDQRGHGDSDWVECGKYRFDDFAQDLITVAGQIEQKFHAKPVVVGASLGGIAGMLAEGETDRAILSALVLVDVTPRMRHDGVDKVLGFMAERADHGFSTLEEASDAIAAYLPHRPRPSDLSGLAKNLRLGADNRYRWHWDPAFVSGENRAPTRAERNEIYKRLESAVKNISTPLMLVRGRASELVDEEMAAEFLKLAPDAEFADVSEAGHMVAGDRNDVFTDAMIDFLDKHKNR